MTDADPFLLCRDRLRGVAYGLLGDLGEADDVVQDVWLRWRGADREAVRNAEAFLVTTATRLAIDRLRSARARRETYVGTWLPTPLVVDEVDAEEMALGPGRTRGARPARCVRSRLRGDCRRPGRLAEQRPPCRKAGA